MFLLSLSLQMRQFHFKANLVVCC